MTLPRLDSLPMPAARLFDVFWVLFFLGTFGAAGALLPPGIAMQLYAWALADLVVLAVIVADPQALISEIPRNWLLLSWPAIAMLSAMWSQTPGGSAYHGFQLLPVVLAGFILHRFAGLEGSIRLLFWSLLVVEVLSAIAIAIHHPLAQDELGNWRGIVDHKNQLAILMCLQAISAYLLFRQGWRRLLTGPAVLGAFVLLGLSHSASSIIVAACLIPVVTLADLYGSRPRLFVLATSGMVAVCAVGLLFVTTAAYNPVDILLNAFGKDTTLTGRSILWSFALDTLAQHPILGVGYGAFWESRGTSGEYLRYVIGQDLVSFHNNVLDVAVGTGAIGAGLFIFTLGQILVRAFRHYQASCAPVDLWPFLLTLWLVLIGMVEYPLFSNSHFQLLLACAAAAASPSTLRKPRALVVVMA